MAAIVLGLPAPGQSAPTRLGRSEVERIVSEFVTDLTAGNYEKAASTMANLGDPYQNDNIRKAIIGLNASGVPIYSDKIVDREYGKTGKDIIYKVGSKENMLFLRFVLHKTEGDDWVVGWFAAQTEQQSPLPRVWSHIYP